MLDKIMHGILKGGLILSSIGVLMAVMLYEIFERPAGYIWFFIIAVLFSAVAVELTNKEA